MYRKYRYTALIKRYFPLEFPLSKLGWESYELRDGTIPLGDPQVLAEFTILRRIVNRMYEKRYKAEFRHQPLKAGDLNAIGLITEVFRYLVNLYRKKVYPSSFKDGLDYLLTKLPSENVEATIKSFVKFFPPIDVLKGKITPEEYIEESTEGVPNRELVLKELVLVFLANTNPAFSTFIELFNDKELKETSVYEDVFAHKRAFFQQQKGLGPKKLPLIELLKEPIKAVPHSLRGQLVYIKENWKDLLPEDLIYRILTALDIIEEEEKLRGVGTGPLLIPTLQDLKGIEYTREPEYEGFTADREWMSKVVLIAKCTYVWLDQLSKKYGRPITKLDQIPDEELDQLARWGFTGLWLIGIWERSPASQKIKRLCGNPEALASAYSIYEYTISKDLGGESAFQNLKQRAFQRGIRIAADIVPNHTGIYSRWVIEHPAWFIQVDHPPFPSYSFTGPDLSDDPRVGIFIEDGYWDRRDAAVVFKRVDKLTGETRYIYHGNDGTSMPWNDTAQLNFLLPQVREAVIKWIIDVARHFSIIRLDAAMTLTKFHYQRLWFPHPGTGGGIPSRAEHGMLKSEFDKHMPKEFWREVVDRINQEIPDTLLLAEAFWLMEGYFVRTLGMHRVYNSAFMNMLKMEDNAKYRAVIKNILEFDPEILRRFVNFMNNPDEETAVVQFGKGDKYFGICTMMVTLPGLPMFGHGQIEGLAEKYGMEYRKAYWNEEVDWDLVRRHEHEIFPLMRKRHLFSGIENFVFYDFFRNDGKVNENVFAYSNRCGNGKVLVVYNNKFEHAAGWILTSCAMAVKTPSGRKLEQKTLAEGLDLRNENNIYYIFKDHKTGLEYIRAGKELAEKGLYVELGAYQYHVFLDFREVVDTEGYYTRVHQYLGGKGVPSIADVLKEIVLEPIHQPFKELIELSFIEEYLNSPMDNQKVASVFREKFRNFLTNIKEFTGSEIKVADEIKLVQGNMDVIISLRNTGLHFDHPIKEYISSRAEDISFWRIPYVYTILHPISEFKTDISNRMEGSGLFDELLLGNVIVKTLKSYGYDEWRAWIETILIKIILSYSYRVNPFETKVFNKVINEMFNDYNVHSYLGFNQYDGVLWFNKERFEELVYWLTIATIISLVSQYKNSKRIKAALHNIYHSVEELAIGAGKCGYKVDQFIELLKKGEG